MPEAQSGDGKRSHAVPYWRLVLRLKFGSHAARVQAIDELGVSYPDRSVDRLIDALRSTDSRLREAAGEALTKTGGAALESLWSALECWLQYREDVAKVLGRIGNPRSVRPLVHALTRGVSDHAVTEALLKIGTAAIEPLVDLLLHEAKNWFPKPAAKALTALGWQPRDTAERLAFALAGRDWNGLAHMGEAAVPALIEFMRRGNLYERPDAARVLGRIGTPDAIEALLTVITEIRNARDTRAALLSPGAWDRIKATGNPELAEMFAGGLQMEPGMRDSEDLMARAVVDGLRFALNDPANSSEMKLSIESCLRTLGWEPAGGGKSDGSH